MAKVDPRTPLRADYRYLQRLIAITLGGKVENVPSEYDHIGRVFAKAGGSWEQVFSGAPKDIALLKKILKVALKKGYLTKKWNWGRNDQLEQSQDSKE